MICRLCPRVCGADRSSGQLGTCGGGSHMRVGRIALHAWEEPPISARNGSGAVFFSGCPLKCVYCQNETISREETGWEISEDELAKAMIRLQEQGACNINLITGTHYAPQIVRAVNLARQQGLDLPAVWNTSGFESVETLELLRGTVDIYLPDFKYWTDAWAGACSAAPRYPETAMRAIAAMKRQQPHDIFAPDGAMQRGVLVRHLVLPGHTREAKHILQYIRDTWGASTAVSLMRQYTPFSEAPGGIPELGRRVTGREYASVVRFAETLGLESVFIQEGSAASDEFVPVFASEPSVS